MGKPYLHNVRPLCAEWPLRLCGSVFELGNNLRSYFNITVPDAERITVVLYTRERKVNLVFI